MTTGYPENEVDAIAMKRRAARRIHEQLSDKSDDRLAYWEERTEALRHKQADRQASESASS